MLVDTTLFILFGIGINNTFASSIMTFNVKDIRNITYTSIYYGNTTQPLTPFDNTTMKKNGASSGLSKGEIGGIITGCVILVSFIIEIDIFN